MPRAFHEPLVSAIKRWTPVQCSFSYRFDRWIVFFFIQWKCLKKKLRIIREFSFVFSACRYIVWHIFVNLEKRLLLGLSAFYSKRKKQTMKITSQMISIFFIVMMQSLSMATSRRMKVHLLNQLKSRIQKKKNCTKIDFSEASNLSWTSATAHGW